MEVIACRIQRASVAPSCTKIDDLFDVAYGMANRYHPPPGSDGDVRCASSSLAIAVRTSPLGSHELGLETSIILRGHTSGTPRDWET